MFHVEHWLCLGIRFVLHISFRFAQNLSLQSRSDSHYAATISRFSKN